MEQNNYFKKLCLLTQNFIYGKNILQNWEWKKIQWRRLSRKSLELVSPLDTGCNCTGPSSSQEAGCCAGVSGAACGGQGGQQGPCPPNTEDLSSAGSKGPSPSSSRGSWEIWRASTPSPHFILTFSPFGTQTLEMRTNNDIYGEIRKWVHVPRERFRKTREDLQFTSQVAPGHRDSPQPANKQTK